VWLRHTARRSELRPDALDPFHVTSAVTTLGWAALPSYSCGCSAGGGSPSARRTLLGLLLRDDQRQEDMSWGKQTGS
jgi:hypothetical protein